MKPAATTRTSDGADAARGEDDIVDEVPFRVLANIFQCGSKPPTILVQFHPASLALDGPSFSRVWRKKNQRLDFRLFCLLPDVP